MDGLADTLVGAAAANVAAHGVVDFRVGGFRFFRKQRYSRHDLAGLAIAALWNIFRNPSYLHRMAPISGQTFNGRDLLSADA